MNPDELQERLRRIDPAASAPVNPVHGPEAVALMEQIMQTQPNEVAAVPPSPARRPRRWLAVVGAAAVVAAGALGVVALQGDDAKAPTTVAYALSAPNPSAMCINIDGIESDPAWSGFEGTVASVDGNVVTIDVSKWFRGGPADQVTLTAPDGGVALEGGTDFVVGDTMLVSVMDGTVLGCGISGVSSPELQALYAKWYA